MRKYTYRLMAKSRKLSLGDTPVYHDRYAIGKFIQMRYRYHPLWRNRNYPQSFAQTAESRQISARPATGGVERGDLMGDATKRVPSYRNFTARIF